MKGEGMTKDYEYCNCTNEKTDRHGVCLKCGRISEEVAKGQDDFLKEFDKLKLDER